MEQKDALKQMLQDIINDKTESAQDTLHDYFVNKTREVSGLGQKSEEVDESINEAKVNIEDVLAKIKTITGGAASDIKAFWTGGDSPNMTKYTEKMENAGYNTAGAWEENKAWFKKSGISKSEYNALVKASL